MEKTKKLVNMNDLAKIVNCNKSCIYYYYSKGYIHSSSTVGRMILFELKPTIEIIKKIYGEK